MTRGANSRDTRLRMDTVLTVILAVERHQLDTRNTHHEEGSRLEHHNQDTRSQVVDTHLVVQMKCPSLEVLLGTSHTRHEEGSRVEHHNQDTRTQKVALHVEEPHVVAVFHAHLGLHARDGPAAVHAVAAIHEAELHKLMAVLVAAVQVAELHR